MRGCTWIDELTGHLAKQESVLSRLEIILVAVEAGPDPGVDQVVRDRIAHALDGDGGLPVHPPRGAEGDGEGLLGQRMEPLLLFEQGLGGLAAAGAMDPVVDRVTELPASLLKLACVAASIAPHRDRAVAERRYRRPGFSSPGAGCALLLHTSSMGPTGHRDPG